MHQDRSQDAKNEEARRGPGDSPLAGSRNGAPVVGLGAPEAEKLLKFT